MANKYGNGYHVVRGWCENVSDVLVFKDEELLLKRVPDLASTNR